MESRIARRGFLLSAATAGAAAAQSRVPPNVLYLHSHDTGRYIQPYGHPVPTPNLQRFASEGVMFRQAFNAAPTCSPSRASLLTGQCPHQNGMFGLAHRGFAMTDYRRHVLHTLRDGTGHESTLVGVQHIANDPKIIGYNRIVPTPTNTAKDVAPAAVDFLKSAPKRPFFLDVGFYETHREFHQPGLAEDERFTQPPAVIPDTPGARRDFAGFKASARVLDDAMGRVLSALASAGLADNTLVICTTDHGIAFPDMKCNLTDHGMGVMLMMRGPGGFTGGKICDALVSQLDLFPTICDVTGARPPQWIEGRSILPLVRGENVEINDAVFSEVNYHAAYEPKRAVRTHRWKYVRHFGSKHTPVLPNCDDGPSKDVWVSAGWRTRPVPHEELFDLVFDPMERRNVIDDPSARTVAQEMRGRMDRWMQTTHDPLLNGDVPAPPGAVVNDPDGLSPKERVRRA